MWNIGYTSYNNKHNLNKHEIKNEYNKTKNIKRSGTSTETQMFQPSQTQCLSPTRDKSPSVLKVYGLKLKNI